MSTLFQRRNCTMQAFVPLFPRTSSLVHSELHTNESTCSVGRHSFLPRTRRDHRQLSAPEKRTRVNTASVKSLRIGDGNRTTRGRSLRLAVLVSGGGRSLENLCEKIEAGSLKGCRIEVVIASKTTAGAIARAKKFGIPTRVLRLKDFEGVTEHFSEAISKVLDEFNVDLVIMAGWLHFYQIPPRYDGKVINIHPSLIPAFCGTGFYGSRVHEAVLKFGVKVTGCTVHLADNKYDHGPIILQKAVPVLDTDTVDELAARVFESEKEALPEAVQLFVDDRLSVENGVVKQAPVSESSRV